MGALAGLMFVLPVSAAERNIAAKGEHESRLGPLSAVELADRLASYGVANGDAVALVEAARIRVRLGGQQATREKMTEGEAKPGGQKSDDTGPTTVESLLAAARSLASDSEIVMALIEEVEAMGTKGVRGGPVFHLDTVRAGTIDVYTMEFRGGELAEVAVLGDGDTDLDLLVFDENGNEICVDSDLSDQAYCAWYPRWTGSFRVEIENLGRVYNDYRLLTN